MEIGDIPVNGLNLKFDVITVNGVIQEKFQYQKVDILMTFLAVTFTKNPV